MSHTAHEQRKLSPTFSGKHSSSVPLNNLRPNIEKNIILGQVNLLYLLNENIILV